jgi:hypothetical protein
MFTDFIYFRIITDAQNGEKRIGEHLQEALHLIIQHCSSLEIESQVKNSNASC